MAAKTANCPFDGNFKALKSWGSASILQNCNFLTLLSWPSSWPRTFPVFLCRQLKVRVWDPPCYLLLHNLEHIRPDFARHSLFVLCDFVVCISLLLTDPSVDCSAEGSNMKNISRIYLLYKKSSKIGFAAKFQKFHFWSNMAILLTWRFHFYLK